MTTVRNRVCPLLVLVGIAAVATGVLAAEPRAARAEALGEIKVTCDRAPDCSSLRALVESVTRECKTDDQRAVAIYNVCRYLYYHHAYPNEPGGISALKMINVYGWSLCGGEHTVMAALWDAAGYPWRYRGWSNPGHTTVEVQYGGRWHYLDTFLKFYVWMPDPAAPDRRTIASQEDIKANPALVTEALVFDGDRKVCYFKDDRFELRGDRANWTAPALLVCGDSIEGVLSGVRSSNNAGSPRGWGAIVFDDPNYSTAVNLAPGYRLELAWDKEPDAWYFRGSANPPGHSCGDKDYRNCPAIGPILEPYAREQRQRTWSNGRLVFQPDLRTDAFLAALEGVENAAARGGQLVPADASKPAAIIVPMASPYVVAKALAAIEGDDARLEVAKGAAGGTFAPVAPDKLTEAVAGLYAYRVRVTFGKPIRRLALTSIVQHNQEALPYLAPGRNKITVTAANPAALGKNRLVVTYAYCPGWRDQTPEQLCEAGAEIARAHHATWSDRPIVVQKVVERFPAEFEIPVPTPKGKQPVYPRMVFLRREVLAPGQSPAPVPAAPSDPAVGPDEELRELPNPWLIGARPPEPRAERPTTEHVVPPKRVAYVSKQGEVFEHRFIKWLKDDSDAWILLVDFDTSRLPDLKNLAWAKLVIHVVESHDKAPMQAGAALLGAPFEPGKPYDFAKLGPIVGTTIVERGDGPGATFDPPRRYEIDATKAVRAWSRGEPAHGLALRIVPNRSIDDGWTVRFTPAREKPVELIVATY